ncbi:MAG: SDR family oxidoreductase [Bacteroidota bacterium]
MNILITGGAGFIGSNLVEHLLEDDRIVNIRVLDDLSTGFYKNIEAFENSEKFEFFKGDISDYSICLKACSGIDRILHQAALGSVPRSIKNPIKTNDVNIGGTLNIFHAAKESNIDRVVYAASSSTYGDSTKIPKVEDEIGQPMSPYAITKLVNELYAKVFNNLYEVDFIGLRYFNIFGPRQTPNGAYAAVIPLFFKAALEGKPPTINGDGSYSRDFTYIDNAVQANKLALFTENPAALNQVYNIACEKRTTLNQLWDSIKFLTQSSINAIHGKERTGDVPHSLASIAKAQSLLHYHPSISVEEGLKRSLEWYREANIL